MPVFRIPHEGQSLLKFGDSQNEGLDPHDIKLLVWNIWKGKRGSPWERDFKALRDDRELILLQEAVADERMSQLFHEGESSHEWHMAASFSWRFAPRPTGVITGAAAKSHTKKFIRGTEREFFFTTPKVSLCTRYILSGHEEDLLVINTHVVNFTTTASFIRFIEELVTMIEGHEGPLILAGDFNTWNFNRWQGLIGILERLGLTYVEMGADPRSRKLDHVFIRGLRVQFSKVREDISSSDHLPLIVNLSTKK